MDATIKDLKTTLDQLKEEFKEHNSLLTKLKSSLTLQEVKEKIKRFLIDVRVLYIQWTFFFLKLPFFVD
jgi:archaellum component FlaC